NAALPHALIATGSSLERDDITHMGLSMLDWLLQEQTRDGHASFIGSNGFYPKGGPKAQFDQQPVEAHAQVSAWLEAYRVTLEPRYLAEATRAFELFLGENDLGLPLYDPRTGGCRDGLHPDRVNQNQGSESTLAFLMALLELRL
ncbi:glycosyl transferase family 1, partial [Leptospira interrogans serovar Pomona]|nr:glycosyl transferase family 1 [Leptospira interrogans serovar Pomona]